jgi:hypothetical protein
MSLVSCDGSISGVYKLFGEHPYIFVNLSAAPGGDGSDWEHAYQQITTAVAAAQEGQEIWVAKNASAYSTVTINKSISLYGGFSGDEASRNDRIYDAMSSTTSSKSVMTVAAYGVVIDGFELSDGSGAPLTITASVTVINCNIHNGNFINISGVTPVVFEKCKFDTLQNTVSNGGALSCSSGSVVKLASCKFLNNQGNGGNNGGAISCTGTQMKISGCSFSSNRGVLGGGAIFITSGLCEITDSTFDNNRCTTGNGGAVSISGGTCMIAGSTFTGNYAEYSGGAIINSGICWISDNCIFSGNFLTTTSYGYSFGGVITNSGSCWIMDSSIIGNNIPVSSGGGIYNSGTLTITNSHIQNNSIDNGSGGGVYSSSGTVNFTDSYFTGNTATTSGNNVYIQGTDGRIKNCHIGNSFIRIRDASLGVIE